MLYGATQSSLFTLNENGSGYVPLHRFSPPPYGRATISLVTGIDGVLYGTRATSDFQDGVTSSMAFRINTDGTDYTVLHQFIGTNGSYVFVAGLVTGSDGVLYGTTSGYNYTGPGTVFKLNRDGSEFTVLHEFANTNTSPDSNFYVNATSLIAGSDDVLYGITAGVSGTNIWDLSSVFKLNRDGGGYTVLHPFATNQAGGGLMVQGSDGVLYGTTSQGGITNADYPDYPDGLGTVFRLNRDGSGYTVLHSFAGGSDGYDPQNLVQGKEGTLYGTTRGGITNDAFSFGLGTLFKLNRDGSGYIVLHQFSDRGGGGFPVPTRPPSLVVGSDGAIFGTTVRGGDLDLGTVFKLFAGPPVITIKRLELNGAGGRLSLSGGAFGATYPLEATPTLSPASWQPLGSATAGIDGSFQFLEPDAASLSQRFYRVGP